MRRFEAVDLWQRAADDDAHGVGHIAVSYTHLDVYKRQDQGHIKAACGGVDIHLHVVLFHLIVLLDGNDDRSLDLFDQVF